MKKKFYLSFVLALAFYCTTFAQEVPETQKIVITKIGATWCPNCGTAAWDRFDELNREYKEDAVILSIHPSRSSELHSPASIDFSENLPQAWGQPLFYINRVKHSTNQLLDDAGEAISTMKSVTPVANTGINAIIKKNSRKLEVAAKVKFFQATSGDYYLSLLVVEDGVIANQASRGADVVHKKILRTAMTENTFGQLIASGDINVNEEMTLNATVDIASDWNTENLEVAAIIWKSDGEAFEFVNAHSLDASFATSLNILEKAGVKMAVSPTIIASTSTISVELSSDLKGLDMAIYNTNGQLVHSVFSGDLAVGNHSFIVNKNSLKGAGIFFLKMEKAGNVISRKFVVE